VTSTNSLSSRVLGLFAKRPLSGSAKTRLAALHGPDWAAEVARAFLLDTIDRLATVAVRRVLAFSPPEAERDFANLVGDRFLLTPQAPGDLGQRLAGFVAEELRDGAESVVLVGTDSPTLPVAFVEQAFRELDHADVVLAPATDGGYCLIGCTWRAPSLFEGVAWSTSRVLADTVARLGDSDCRLALLPPWYDVDTPDDWVMLCGHLAAMRRAGVDPGVPRTEALTRRGKND
jgi:rSAM/selenodomain-associated transferase 1